MPDPLVLYSTNTRLAFLINEHYYGQLHYVWCNPYFNADSAPRLNVDMPPSATPCDIYRGYQSDIERGDRHGDHIRRNRAGLVRGIESRKAAGVISESQFNELQEIVASAAPDYFRPLLYVIPFTQVGHSAKPQPAAERAALFSQELVLEDLHRSRFDVVWW